MRQVYSTCAALALAGIAALLALYSLGLTAWIHAGSLPSSLPAPLWAAGALVATRTLTAVLLGMFRLEERTRLYSVIDVAQRLFTFLFALAVLVWIARRPSLFLLAAAAAEGLVLAAAWLLSARRERVAFTAFDRPLAGRILAYSSPLVGYEILMILLGSVDRPLIQAYLGSESLGYWAAAISLATYAEEALQAPLGLAIYPICQRLWQESGLDAVSAFLSRVLIYLGGAMGLLLAGSIVTSREIIILLGSRKYEAAAPLLAPLMFALLVYAMAGILNTGPLLMKKTLSMAGVVFGALCAKVALALLLLPSFGLWGMAGATFAGYAVLLAFSWRRL